MNLFIFKQNKIGGELGLMIELQSMNKFRIRLFLPRTIYRFFYDYSGWAEKTLKNESCLEKHTKKYI